MANKKRVEKMRETRYQKWKQEEDHKLKYEIMKYEEIKKELMKERNIRFENMRPSGILKIFKSMIINY